MDKKRMLEKIGKKLDKLGEYLEVGLENKYSEKIKKEYLENKKNELNKYKRILGMAQSESVPVFLRNEIEESFNLEKLEQEYNELKEKLKNDIEISLGRYIERRNEIGISLGDKKTRWSSTFFEIKYDTKTGEMFVNTPSGGWEKGITLKEQLPGIKIQVEIADYLQNNQQILQEYIEKYIQANKEYNELIKQYEILEAEIKKEEIEKNNIKLNLEIIDKILDYITKNKSTIIIHPEYREYPNGHIADMNSEDYFIYSYWSSDNRRHLGWIANDTRYKKKNKQNLINELEQLYISKKEYQKLLNELEIKQNNNLELN